ncbi:MAG: DUF4062 domain-containing protein [Terriglobia bacterium]
MRRPAVFVSSTCYDLKQVRADTKQFLEGLGLDPVLSEYNSFPVDPDLGTVDNCLKAVESKADIFVLIVGARYGSPTDQGQSVTNLEFSRAKAKGIPVYVFVTRTVLEMLQVWQANPSADFSKVVDTPKLLEFVGKLKGSGETWVFPFDTAQDIFDVLRTQLALLFMDALALRLRASSARDLLEKFGHLRGTPLRLLIERPPGWEYLLFTEALYDGVRGLTDLKRDWEYQVALGTGTVLSPSGLLKHIPEKVSEARRIVDNLTILVNQAWPSAVGRTSEPADPEAILYVAERLTSVYRNALHWKLDFRRLAVPPEMDRLKVLASCLCDNMVREVEEFSHFLKTSTAEAVRAARAGEKAEVRQTLTLTAPDMTEYEAELRRVTDLISSGVLKWD